MRGKGVAKEKDGSSGADQGSSKTGCTRQCVHDTKARLAHKHSVNQRIAERNAAIANANKPSNEGLANNSNVSQKKSQTKKLVQKPYNVDDIVNSIEGNPSTDDKKRVKKERQKQQRLEAIKQQQEEEKRLQAAIAKEQQRIKDEEKRREEEAQMSNKQRKKANQRAKKLAEQGLPSESLSQAVSSPLSHLSSQSLGSFNPGKVAPNLFSSSLSQPSSQPLGNLGAGKGSSNPLSSLEDLKAQLNNLTTNTMNQLRSGLMKPSLSTIPELNSGNNYTPNMASNLEPVQNLGQLKAQHQREREMLELKHRQALEEEQMKAMYKQKQQYQSPQYPVPQYQPQTYQSNQSISPPKMMQQKSSQPIIKKNKGNSNPVGNNDGNTRLQGATRSNISGSAAEALAKAEKNPGNQIRISRNAQGGVDFTTIPANQVKQNREK